MRSLWTAFGLMLLAAPAMAQSNDAAAARFQTLQAVDAARLNQAAQNDPRAREALDEATKRLNEANHPAGRLLEGMRP